MKQEAFKELLESMLEHAKTLLLKDGFVRPVAFIVSSGDIQLIPISFRTNEEKNLELESLRKLCKKKKAKAVFFVTESWYVTSDTPKLKIEPAKDPNRKECIVVTGECKEMKTTLMQIYDRKDEKIIFGEKIDMGEDVILKFNFGIRKNVEYDKGWLN